MKTQRINNFDGDILLKEDLNEATTRAELVEILSKLNKIVSVVIDLNDVVNVLVRFAPDEAIREYINKYALKFNDLIIEYYE